MITSKKTINDFINKNYEEIILMSRKITKSPDYQDIAHHCIASFIEAGDKVIHLITDNEAMRYISGMIHRNYYSSNSQYHKLYRQNNLVGTLTKEVFEIAEDDYIDEYEDDLLKKIDIILARKNNDPKLYYKLELLKKYSECRNYSKLSRDLNIPRTSISLAVREAVEYVKNEIEILN